MLVSAIQMNSGVDVEENWQNAVKLVEKARRYGANLIILPENFLYEGGILELDFEEWDLNFSELARKVGATIVFGTITDNSKRNTSLVYDSNGIMLAHYDKIHLFDIDIPGGPCEKESDYIVGGDKVVSFFCKDLGCNVGLAICYDLRFPELFRRLVDDDVKVIVMPSSFTKTTGIAHWEVLLRARAIENQVYIIAPNQIGLKANGKNRYGHSMIIDPWGRVIDQAIFSKDVLLAKLDFDYQDKIRSELPCLRHRKLGWL